MATSLFRNWLPAAFRFTLCRRVEFWIRDQYIGEFQGEHTVPVTTGNNCSVSGTAKAYVMNATVIPLATS